MILKLSRPNPAVLAALEDLGCRARVLTFPFGTFVVALGLDPSALAAFQAMDGVAWARTAGSRPILAAREQCPEGTRVPLGAIEVGGETLSLMAGPCSVEDREQILTTARYVAAYGANALRGGAYKPRTSPYAFQGLGQAGVELLREAGDAAELPVVTEVMEPGDVAAMTPFVDCFQIGARNMSCAPLLRWAAAAGPCCSSGAPRPPWRSSCWPRSTSSWKATPR